MRAVPALLLSLVILNCGAPPEAQVAGTGNEPGVEEMAASLEVYVRPAGVHLVLHVTNAGKRPVAFVFPTSQRSDFAIYAAGGDRVWRWSDGMSFLQVVAEDTLAAGETWAMEADWKPGAGAGAYEARGWLTAREGHLEQTTSFTLP